MSALRTLVAAFNRCLSLRRAFACLVALSAIAIFPIHADEPTAAQCAHEAAKARDSGLIVRAWMLYSEAARLDPANSSYRTDRDALAPFARMLTQTGVETEQTPLKDLRAAAAAPPPQSPGFSYPAPGELERLAALRPPPKLKIADQRHSFELRGDEKTLYNRVANAYGVNVLFDVALDPKKDLRFEVTDLTFREVMEALTDVTTTFLFPVGEHTIFVARDDKIKRDRYEPEVALSVPLPNSVDAKALNDASTAVRSAIETQRLLLDGATRTIIIHDRLSKARIARSLLEALLQPRPQVNVGFELLSLDQSVDLHYGLSLPTSFPVISLGNTIGGFQNLISAPSGFTQFLTFGGGTTLFGLGLTSATAFATSSKSWTTTIYQGQVLAEDGQVATMYVGEQYPIATAFSTGLSGATSSVIPQTTEQELGVKLKVTPHILERGEVSLDVEAEYQTLGAVSLNSIPAINERTYKGSIVVSPGQWAVIAGIDSISRTVSRTGIPGLANIPFLHHVTAENTRSDQNSRLLVLLKPRLTSLPVTTASSPEFNYGSANGSRVLL